MSIGKCQQFLRFIFGLMIFLLLFSGGLSRPLSAHAAGGFGGIEIAADFNFSPVIAAADGIFSEIFRKAGAGITAVADFCVAAGETFGREIAATGRKIAGGAQSFSATAGATAGRGAASLKSGISEIKSDLSQGAAAVKDEVFPEFCRRTANTAAAAAGLPLNDLVKMPGAAGAAAATSGGSN